MISPTNSRVSLPQHNVHHPEFLTRMYAQQPPAIESHREKHSLQHILLESDYGHYLGIASCDGEKSWALVGDDGDDDGRRKVTEGCLKLPGGRFKDVCVRWLNYLVKSIDKKSESRPIRHRMIIWLQFDWPKPWRITPSSSLTCWIRWVLYTFEFLVSFK